MYNGYCFYLYQYFHDNHVTNYSYSSLHTSLVIGVILYSQSQTVNFLGLSPISDNKENTLEIYNIIITNINILTNIYGYFKDTLTLLQFPAK